MPDNIEGEGFWEPQFNVSAYPEDQSMNTVLVEGSVHI